MASDQRCCAEKNIVEGRAASTGKAAETANGVSEDTSFLNSSGSQRHRERSQSLSSIAGSLEEASDIENACDRHRGKAEAEEANGIENASG
jgi:hypothetical protein